MPLPKLDTRHAFFTGKGGVGNVVSPVNETRVKENFLLAA